MKNSIFRANGIMRRYTFIILIAIELLLSFSFFGYIHIEPISVTIAYIPVILAGALTGPAETTAVGAVFGLSSMWKASANYVMPSDHLFSPFFSGNPFGSFMLSTGSRMLFGLVTGLLYMAARRSKHPRLWIGVISFLGRSLHSIMVYSCMSIFFPEAGYTPLSTLKGVNLVDLLVDLATAALVLACVRLTYSEPWLQFQHRLETSQALKSNEKNHLPIIAVAISVITLAAVAVTFYFAHRLDHVLEVNDINLTETAYADTVHLQVQFMFGIISLTVLAVVFLYLAWQNTAYMTNEGKYDSLTGVLVRRSFFVSCSRTMRNIDRDNNIGYFIMVDIDYFKEINDTYGHPEGDKALKEVAFNLKEIFGQNTLIGRMGGDEFAVLICTDMGIPDMRTKLDSFLDRIHKITWGDHRLTCSIGVFPIESLRMPEDLYNETDRILYMAKEQGRDRYVIKETD